MSDKGSFQGSNKGRVKGGDWDGAGWWEARSLGEKVILGIGLAILGLGLLAFFGWVVMALWNWLMPEIFGLKTIDYWQAWGLFLLSSILFKDWGSDHDSRREDKKRKRQLRSYMQDNVPQGEKESEGSPKV